MIHHVIRRPTASRELPDFAGLTRIEFTADSLTLSHGDAVDSWTDLGSNGIAATNTGTARPTYKTDSVYGPYLDFDGIDDDLNATGLSLDMSSGATVFVCGQATAFDLGRGPGSGRAAAAARTLNIFGQYYVTSADFRIDVDRNISAVQWYSFTAMNSVAEIMAARMSDEDPSANPVHVNGVAETVLETGTMNPPATTIAELTIGDGYNSGMYKGKLWDYVIYYGRQMTLYEEQLAWTQMNNRRRVRMF